ncbi:MAG: redoxin domain-containing protein [Thermomicrobiales bacterium]|nr:redoxin domain-containing protein [Thermomicrobiales bacterium]
MTARRRGWRLAWLLPLLLMAGVAAGFDAVALAEQHAPNYAAHRLDGEGDLALADLRGEVVLLNGWATWCHPCREEMPLLETLHDDYHQTGLHVVGVSIDRGDVDDRVREFARDAGVTFTLLRDPQNHFARTFRATGVPETLLIGRDGTLLYRWKGPLTGGPEDRALIENALAGSADAVSAAPIARVAFPVAFVAGLLSFLSPCVLPLIPTYAGIVTGLSLRELGDTSPEARARARRATLTNGALFVGGFSLVFIALGASATLLGGLLADYRLWIARIGALVLAVLGLHLLGILRLPLADRTVRLDLATRSAGRVGTLLIGVAFGAGWTPCIGPALAGILTIAATSASVAAGIGLLAVYSLGLAIPFLLATAAMDRFLLGSGRIRQWLPRLQQANGVLMLLVAALLATDSMTHLADFAARFSR